MSFSPRLSLSNLSLTRGIYLLIGLIVWITLVSGCSQPIGITRVTPEESYRISTTSPLTEESGLSNDATSVLFRSNLHEDYERDPKLAISKLHKIALKDDRRDILFALAELSYALASTLPEEDSGSSQKLLARDVYLESAVYAYLYLLAEGKEPLPSPFDNRFREACELYNRSLAHALKLGADDRVSFLEGDRSVQGSVLKIQADTSLLGRPLSDFESFHPADAYDVYGFTVRNRSPGLGLPIIGVTRRSSSAPNGGALPITVFFRVNGSLAEIDAGKANARLELYSSYEDRDVEVNGQQIPLQTDTTTPLAYRLNDAELWKAGLRRFISGEPVSNHMLFIQPYQTGKIPVVLVHGTGSSPVWWAEMVNTLRSDPIVRERFQFWFYEYTSNIPIVSSGGDLRDTLTDMVNHLDPKHQDDALSKMVVIGHSQGGLLTNLTAVDPGDRLWRSISDRPIDSIDVDPFIYKQLKRNLFFSHLPFVKRVIYISTPHRGSFLTTSWVRNLASRILTLPGDLLAGSKQKFAQLAGQLKLPEEIREKMPTSIDGMSPSNPILKALVDEPLAKGIRAHSIIAVLPDMDVKTGNDGVVEYSSAHISAVDSEFVVRTGHSAQGHPLTIEEVRRILHVHLEGQ